MIEENQDLATQDALATESNTIVEKVEKVEEPKDTRDIVARELDKHEPEGKTEETAKKSEEKADKNTEEKTVDTVAKQPFSAWKKEAREALSQLDPKVQGFITEREAQFHKGIEQYKSDSKFAKTINAAVAPHQDYLKQLGITADVALSTLVSTERKLRTGNQEEKLATFQQLAHDYGIDLGFAAQQPFDPKLHGLQQQVSRLQSQLSNTQASQQSAEDEQLGQTIDQFAQSHEYFDRVHEDMADLLSKGRALTLEEAYEKAIRIHDDLFSEYQSKQAEENKRQEALKANQAAQAAKSAAVSVRGAPTGVTHNPTPRTTEDAVRMAMRTHGL